MTIDTVCRPVPNDVAPFVTLDAPKFIPADARHVSRLLKAAGLTRAERLKGTSDQYSWGFHASGNDLSVYGRSYSTNDPRDIKLLEQATEVLRAKGFVVTGAQSMYREVWKPVVTEDDEASFWYGFHASYVAAPSPHREGTLTLMAASAVPAFDQERRARQQRAKDAHAKAQAEARAASERRDAIVAALRAAGLDLDHRSGQTTIVVAVDDLAVWLRGRVNIPLPD